MKKKLSLLLALVLAVSLCTVSASADHTHTWNEPTFKTTDGKWKADFTCSGCNETKTVDCTVSYNSARYVGPTCTQPKIEAYIISCELDGKIYRHDYEVTGDILHAWSEYSVVWSGDCKTATFTLTCSECGATHVESVDTTSSTTPATCTADGETTYKAFLFAFSRSRYTFSEKKTVTIPGGHVYGEPEFVWSDDYGTATAEFTCERDSTHTESITCTVKAQETPATCTKDGQITYTATCTLDGKTYTDTKTAPGAAAAGHSYKAVVTRPTCTKGGYTTYTCTVCGDSYTGNTRAALLHAFGEWNPTGDGEHTSDCLRRGCDLLGRAKCGEYTYTIKGDKEDTTFTLCPVCGEIDDDTRLELVEDAAAKSSNRPRGTLTVRKGELENGETVMSIGFAYSGELTQPKRKIEMTLPAEELEGYTATLLDADGTETPVELTENEKDETVTFTLSFDKNSKIPVAVLHLAEK